ncbi:hypothetical protein AB0I76_24370, partial [Micromonospora sp. NPDC049799]
MISVVVPTLGRPSLAVLLDALAAQVADLPDPEVLLVDDRRDSTGELAVPGDSTLMRHSGDQLLQRLNLDAPS